jgi:hypothetical protein
MKEMQNAKCRMQNAECRGNVGGGEKPNFHIV